VTEIQSYSKVGYCEGKGVGACVGNSEVGRLVGLGEGIIDGAELGEGVGTKDGIGLGIRVGITDGLGEGDPVGKLVGNSVGLAVSKLSHTPSSRDISILITWSVAPTPPSDKTQIYSAAASDPWKSVNRG